MNFKGLFKKRPMLDLGVPCKWEDIKVGEVFGLSGCFSILYKDGADISDAIILDDNFRDVDWLGKSGEITNELLIHYNDFYKLPKETQELYVPSVDSNQELYLP